MNYGGPSFWDDLGAARLQKAIVETLPPKPVTQEFTPQGDSTIRGGNYGDRNSPSSKRYLITKEEKNLSYSRKSYIQFNVESLKGTIDKVSLQLTPNYMGSGAKNVGSVELYGLQDGVPGESWDENSITWNNAPGDQTTSPNKFESSMTFLGEVKVDANFAVGKTIEFTSPELLNWLKKDTNGVVTIAIDRNGLGSNKHVAFAAKESSKYPSPKLVVTTLTIPNY